MTIGDFVTVNITRDSLAATVDGFGVPMYLSATAAWAERVRSYDGVAGVLEDFPSTTSPEYLYAAAMFGQENPPPLIKIGRCALPPTQVYALSLPAAPVVGDTIGLTVRGDGVTETEIALEVLANLESIAPTHGTDLFTYAAHGMVTGDGPYRLATSAADLPLNLTVDTNYWIIRLTADTFQLASSYANAIAETEVTFDDNGTGDHDLLRAANDVINAQIVDRLNSVVGNNYVAAIAAGAGDTDTATVTADAAGEWFSLATSNPATLEAVQTHADPGVATDLAAITLEDDDWYFLITSFNSNAYVLAAAAWIETQKKQYLCDLDESDTVTLAAGGSDTAQDLETLGYDRTSVWYHPSSADMLGSSICGVCAPIDPGGETWALKNVSGVSPVSFTSTQKTNLRNKTANSYRTVGSDGRTFDGVTVSGEYIDTIRGLDWLENDMQVAVFNAIAGAPKVPFTDAGIALVENEIRGSLSRAVAAGVLAADPKPDVSVPRAANVSSANKAARILPDVRFTGTLAGAIHSITINGTVSV
jgi:hypothetical protein